MMMIRDHREPSRVGERTHCRESHPAARRTDAERDLVVVVHHRGIGHVAAISAAIERDALSIQIALRRDPVERGTDVLDGVGALQAVVEFDKGLAVTGRAANVGREHRDLQLERQILHEGVEVRAELRFRSAVNVDEHGEPGPSAL